MIRIQTRHRRTPDISIAPLIDCVLLLLIFFLLTSSFSARRGMEITLPESSTARHRNDQVIEVAVAATGEVTFEGRTVDLPELTRALENARAAKRNLPVLMVADKELRLGRITEVIDCIRSAKVETLSIAAKQVNGDKEGHLNDE